MGLASLALNILARRQDTNEEKEDFDAGKELLDLLSDPFANQLSQTSLYSALGTSLGFTAFIAICFSFLRPFHQAVYAPKSKHADDRHAPPPIGRQPWSWIMIVTRISEEELITQVGMDATIFLRFVRMCRNMFLVLAIIGISILVPVHYTQAQTEEDWTLRITPLNLKYSAVWAQVAVAWLFDAVVAGFLWWNYRKVLQLRRKYFETEEYQNSLHSRTLMLYDIPKPACSDEGIARIIDEVVPESSFARTAIARNVKDLPNLIAEHGKTVRKLEKVLAKYLKKPDQLPAGRPTCRPSKKDRSYGTYPKGQKLDAIEYLTQRIRDLEVEIKEVRASVDKRSSMPYGFASYSDINEAHNIAYALRKKKPHGATVTMAPRPNDIIWDNMALSAAVRNRRRFTNALWVLLLTFFWIAPNAMIAIFLVNLSNLGKLWPAFQDSLESSTDFWGVVQGIASPALMSLVYLVLPIIFRRLSIKAGDKTKTGRERHVLGRLYAFFVFNNLIVFSLYSTIYSFVHDIVDQDEEWRDVNKVFLTLFSALCRTSPFWVTYLLQRQLGAAVDLAQIWTLICGFFLKTFSSPTPRELIELTAPQPFEYASYYNYFLFYATVTLAFSGIQPLVLVATAMYFSIDSYLKKYLLLYVFVTKTESGGVFWRVLFNRLIFGAILGNIVVLLTVWSVRSGFSIAFWAAVPLPFLMIAFKVYCKNVFDEKMRYYSTRNVNKHPESRMQKEGGRSEKLASRFGHPALYKPLITPMVHKRAQNLLPAVYKGRLTDGREAGADDLMSVSGYSDMYALNAMQGNKPGKAASGLPGFEYVSEQHLDFEYYKNRAEFTEEHGGGELYGRPGDITRPDTPGSIGGASDPFLSRPGTPGSGRSTPFMPNAPRRIMTGGQDTAYQGFRPPSMVGDPGRGRSPLYIQDNGSSSGLVRNAAGPPMSPPPFASDSREASRERYHTATPPIASPAVGTPVMSYGPLAGGPQGYSGLAQSEETGTPVADPGQYDYFRGGRNGRRTPGEGW
jgi:hypothetical protein